MAMKESFVVKPDGAPNGIDIKDKISTMSLTFEISYATSHETYDGTLVRIGRQVRPVITLTFIPGTVNASQGTGSSFMSTFTNGIPGLVNVTYPYSGGSVVADFWVDSDIAYEDLGYAVDGEHILRLNPIVLRAKNPW